jgi:helicase
MMLLEWIKEKKENELFTEFALAPGTLFGKTQILEWLAYSTIELSKVLHEERHLVAVEKLSRRIKYGVKEELLLLVELKGIGRARARKLFNSGIKTPSEAKNNLEKVEMILGKKVSQELEKQLTFGK